MLPSSITCLAFVIYFEARSEEELLQKHVAQVAINRTLDSYPSTKFLCKEVFKKGQFNWSSNIRFFDSPSDHNYLKSNKFMSKYKIREPDSWGDALDLSISMLGSVNKINDARYFHTHKSTKWSRNLKFLIKIGKFKFFTNA
jgi:hypothetical protein